MSNEPAERRQNDGPFKPAEAAAYIGLAVGTLANWRAAKPPHGPAFFYANGAKGTGGQVRYTKAALDEWCARSTVDVNQLALPFKEHGPTDAALDNLVRNMVDQAIDSRFGPSAAGNELPAGSLVGSVKIGAELFASGIDLKLEDQRKAAAYRDAKRDDAYYVKDAPLIHGHTTTPIDLSKVSFHDIAIVRDSRPDNYDSEAGYKVNGPSQEAAETIQPRAALLRELVLDAFKLTEKAFKGDGMTADEAAALIGESILSIRPRLSELVSKGQLVDTGTRRKNASGRPATVWRLA